jgi:hypothetical protein
MMDSTARRRRDLADALERLVTVEISRHGAPPGTSARNVTTVVLALFDGLVRQRRVDPAAVPDGLFPEALRWLLAGLAVYEPGNV